MTKCGKCGTELECLGGCSAHHDNWYCPKCAMTTTKEDQIRAEFEKNVDRDYLSRSTNSYDSYITELMWKSHKSCAESYEKKLAEKDAENEGLKHYMVTAHRAIEKQLAEANDRNDMLVEALKNTAGREDGDKLPCWCADDLQAGLFKVTHAKYCINAREALSESTESAAAWKAEIKLEELEEFGNKAGHGSK